MRTLHAHRTRTASTSLWLDSFAETRLPPIPPRFNVAPSQSVPVIRMHDGEKAVALMRWGFQPAWLKKGNRPPPTNARGETLLERPMFKGATNKGRCLIPADGVYEWKPIPGRNTKQPIHFRLASGELFAFAGLWVWGGDEVGPTCAIITTTPNDLVATVHDRMPVILTEHGERVWMDPEAPAEEALTVLGPYPADLMEAFAVSTAVNTPGGGGPELLHSRWTLSGTGPDGGPLNLSGTTADVVRRQADGTWLFAIDNPWGTD